MADLRQSGSYQKIAKPAGKTTWRQKVYDFWSRSWYFERLLYLLLALVLPLVAAYLYDSLSVRFALKREAVKVALALRQIKDEAHELDTLGSLEARPNADGLSCYRISFATDSANARQVNLPPGMTLAGSVQFDAQGVPKRAVVLKLRQGLRHADVVINAQGSITVP